MWRNLHNLPLTAQSFRDSQDKSSAFHGASFAAWAKAPAIPLDWPISVVASAIDQGRPGGRWSACRPFYRSGAAGRMGRARGGAGRGRRTPADRRAPSSGSCWRARWRRRRTGRPRGRGTSGRRAPPAGRRCRGSRTRCRIRIRPDSVDGFCAAFGRLSSLGQSAPSSSAGPRRPSAECVPALPRIASMRPNGSGAASSRAAQARAPASRCPWAAGARFPPGRLNGAGESGRTRKGHRPAPTPLNETHFLSYKPKKRGARRLRRAPRVSVVEPRGIEPLTSWLPAMRSPS